MKKLSIEEKAKRYDEGLEKIKNLVSCGLIYEDAAIQVFSELCESEDERIRKELIGYFTGWSNNHLFRGFKAEQIIVWLEKQCEQKSSWSAEDEEMYKEVLTDIIYAKNDLKAKECHGLSKRAMEAFNWFSNRYKSLRPQSHWIPSDEQLNALHWCVMNVGGTEHQVLQELLEQLEKLKE